MSDFDPDAYIQANSVPAKGDFDPDAYIAQGHHGMDVVDSGGMAQAGLEHFGNAASMGYLPQLHGLIQKLTPDPNADVNAKLAAQGFQINEPKYNDYTGARDATIARMKQQSKDHPIVSGIGTVGGVLSGGALLSGLQGARAATLGGRVFQGAKTGALMGAVANPGDTEGEIDPIQLGGRARNAEIGAALGAAIPLATQGVSYGAGKVGDYLSNKAALKAARALGRPTPTQAAQMAASGQDAEIGRTLLNEGAVPVLGTPSRIASRVDALKEGIGQKIGNLIESAGDAKTIDAQKLGMDILDSPELAAMRKTPGMESTVSAIEKQVETLAKNGEMTLGEAQALRQGIDKSINFNKAAPDMRGAQEGLYQQRTAIRNAMNDSINSLNPGAGKDALLTANHNYSNLSKASDILEREMGRNQANRGVSLTDTIAGAAGLAHGGPLGAAALAGLNKFGRTFGNSIQARGYDAVANALPSVSRAASSVAANPVLAQRVAQSIATPPQNQSSPETPIDSQTLGIFKANPKLIESIADPALKAAIIRQMGREPAAAQGKAHGGVIHGKAKVDGDSKANDTVPTMLSPGEIVIPRSHANDPELAKAFIDHLFKNPKGHASSSQQGQQGVAHMADGGQVDGETLGSIIGYPGSPKPKPDPKPKGMAHGGVVPAKGLNRFAQQGAAKLALSEAAANHLMRSPKGKHLLIQASDLQPGSKAMQRIKEQLKSMGVK